VGPKRRQVAQLRVRRNRSLTIVRAPCPAVLIRYRTPTKIGDVPIGNRAKCLDGIYWRLADSAKMGPIVTEVEYIDELLSRPETSQLDDAAERSWRTLARLAAAA
jgi:hypothetical protein